MEHKNKNTTDLLYHRAINLRTSWTSGHCCRFG